MEICTADVLNRYLKDHQMTKKKFADQTGLSYKSICNYCSGRSRPDIYAMLLIYQKTGLNIFSTFNLNLYREDESYQKLYKDIKTLHDNLEILMNLMNEK